MAVRMRLSSFRHVVALLLRELRRSGVLLALALVAGAGFVPYLFWDSGSGPRGPFVAEAVAHAGVVVSVERWAGVLVEPALWRWFRSLPVAWQWFWTDLYLVPHLLALVFGLPLVFLSRRRYAWLFALCLLVVLVVSNLLAIVYPVAPLRLLPGVGGDPLTVELARRGVRFDDYAALPSVHVAYAMQVWLFVRWLWPRWRWLALSYLMVVSVVVVVTGNHWVLDVVAGVLLGAWSFLVVLWLWWSSARWVGVCLAHLGRLGRMPGVDDRA